MIVRCNYIKDFDWMGLIGTFGKGSSSKLFFFLRRFHDLAERQQTTPTLQAANGLINGSKSVMAVSLGRNHGACSTIKGADTMKWTLLVLQPGGYADIINYTWLRKGGAMELTSNHSLFFPRDPGKISADLGSEFP